MSHILHLSKDKKLIDLQEENNLQKSKHFHLSLCKSVISQQLSTKVAAIIYNRFLLLFKKKSPSVKDILALDFDTLKAVGLSASKTNYIINA